MYFDFGDFTFLLVYLPSYTAQVHELEEYYRLKEVVMSLSPLLHMYYDIYM